VTDSGRESLTDTFFLTSRANLCAFWITEGNPHLDAVLAFLLNFFSPGRMRLRQMKTGVDKDVYALLRGSKQRQPKGVRDGAALGIDSDGLAVGLVGHDAPAQLRPQVDRVFIKLFGGCYGDPSVRRAAGARHRGAAMALVCVYPGASRREPAGPSVSEISYENRDRGGDHGDHGSDHGEPAHNQLSPRHNPRG